MTILEEKLGSGQLHHSHILTGDSAAIAGELAGILNGRFGADFVAADNPDYLFVERGLWSIEDSRYLKNWAARKPARESVKCAVVILAETMTEAQNSLLKTLEEPAEGTYFFFIARTAGIFLPTILSRCQLIELESGASRLAEAAARFLAGDLPVRYQVIQELLARQDQGERLGPDFLNELLEQFWTRFRPSPGEAVRAAGAIVRAAGKSRERGGSLRLLLEHLAAVVPVP
jgi:hypothetical protein